MGCDIHFHSEVKINGKWKHHSSNRVERNYGLFSKMADVRNNGSIEPISKPKGLPSDVSLITKMYSDNCDNNGHSHSYLTSLEIKNLYDWMKENNYLIWHQVQPYKAFGTLFGHDYSDFFDDEIKNEFPKQLEDFRFVFWFDN